MAWRGIYGGVLAEGRQKNSGGGGSPSLGFNTGLRRLHVSQDSSAPLDGSTPDLSFTTIQAGLNALLPGDVMTVADGRFNEVLTISNFAGTGALPGWVVAENRGGVRIANTLTNTENGSISWTNTGSNIYSISGVRPYMGYDVERDDYLQYYKSRSDLLASSIPVSGGTANKPSYGMGFAPDGGSTAENASGTIYVRLRGNVNPNGEEIRLTDTFGRTQMTWDNADNLILDGFHFEGAGDGRAIEVNTNSANAVIRNCLFTLCRHGVRCADNTTLYRCEYRYEGFDTWVDEVVNLNGSASIGKVFDIAKDYYTGAVTGGDSGNALLEGSLETGRDAATDNVTVDEALLGPCFDGSRLGEFDNSELKNSVLIKCHDDGVQNESFRVSNPSSGNVIHDCRFIDCRRDVSHQGSNINGEAHVYRCVMEHRNTLYHHNTFYSIKMVSTPLTVDVYHYQNTYILPSAENNNQLWADFGGATGNRILHLFNNIIIAENDIDSGGGSNPALIENNVLVASSSDSTVQGTNGVFAGTAEADMDLDATLVPEAGSPAENAGRTLPGGFPDSNVSPGANDDCGAFPVGSTPGADWPRTQSRNAWVTTLPANWTSPGVGGGSDVAVLDALSADADSSSPADRTVSAGSDRMLALLIWTNGSTDTISAVTYGGQAMTERVAIASAGGFPARCKIWTIGESGIAAAAGSSFVLTGTTNGRLRFGSISFENVNQASPIVDNGSGIDSGGNPANVTLSTEAGGYALAICTQDFDGGTATWGADLTELIDLITTGGLSFSMHAAGATTDGTTSTADPTTSGSPTQQSQAAISIRKA